MSSRVYTGAIVLLMMSTAWLFYLIQQVPKADDLVRNQISLSKSQNLQTWNRIKLIELETNHQTSTRSGPVWARKETSHALILLDSLNKLLTSALQEREFESLLYFILETKLPADRTNYDSTYALAPSLRELAKQIEAAAGTANRLSRELALENARTRVYDDFESYLSSLSEYGVAMTLKFDRGFQQRPATWKKGLISVQAPTRMQLGEPRRVSVQISKDLRENLLEKLPPTEQATVDSLWVGDIMIVKLQGDRFAITPYDEDEQGVLDGGVTQWEYDVTALATGKHRLMIKVGIIYHVPDLGATRKFFPVYEHEVEIEVDFFDRIASFATERWEFLISTLVLPVSSMLYNRFQRRRLRQKARARTESKSVNSP